MLFDYIRSYEATPPPHTTISPTPTEVEEESETKEDFIWEQIPPQCGLSNYTAVGKALSGAQSLSNIPFNSSSTLGISRFIHIPLYIEGLNFCSDVGIMEFPPAITRDTPRHSVKLESLAYKWNTAKLTPLVPETPWSYGLLSPS